MNSKRSAGFTPVAIIALFVTVGFSGHLLAYVDLGTGSYMLQLLVAGFLGMVFSARSLLARARAFFVRPRERKRES